MRIISGKYKRMQLEFPKDAKVRPTTDKIRESVFNIIGPYFDEGNCLDVFSGSGSLGIEAISRGIKKCYFGDINNNSIKALNQNIRKLDINSYEIYKLDYMKLLIKVKNIKFDLVFLDPPYNNVEYYCNCIQFIHENNMLVENGYIICEHSKELDLGNYYNIIQYKSYGNKKITILGEV